MTIEERLKDLMISHSGTVKAFADTVSLPYTTVDTILRRGIYNAGVSNIIKICNELEISTDALADGKIVTNRDLQLRNAEDLIEAIKKNVDIILVDGEHMTEEEFAVFSATLDFSIEVVKRMREK